MKQCQRKFKRRKGEGRKIIIIILFIATVIYIAGSIITR